MSKNYSDDNINYLKEMVAYSAHFIFENSVDFHKKLYKYSKFDFTKFKYKFEYVNAIKLTDDYSYIANTTTYAVSEENDIVFTFTYNRGYDLFVMYVHKLSTNELLTRDFIDSSIEFPRCGYTCGLVRGLKNRFEDLKSYCKENGAIITECTGDNLTRDNWDPVNGSSDTPVM